MTEQPQDSSQLDTTATSKNGSPAGPTASLSDSSSRGLRRRLSLGGLRAAEEISDLLRSASLPRKRKARRRKQQQEQDQTRLVAFEGLRGALTQGKVRAPCCMGVAFAV
jgi:hypothetical protein